MKRQLWWSVVWALCLLPATAHAFCGFYVGSAGGKLYNNATQVVLMREGTRTVISMQNNYQGPPKDFAMVVPVPVVLQESDVKTLPRAVFDRVDRLASPRLVEYWEQDPCAVRRLRRQSLPMMRAKSAPMKMGSSGVLDQDLGVTVEAEFAVGEYQVAILSARDSSGLDSWLRQEKYNIPAGAEPVLQPYVQQGMKFFVAKVNSSKVKFVDGQAQLSPLRFHYDAKTFFLPVRLGLLNSKGTQDLIVHILSKGQRYEVANYNNVTVPTNIDVTNYTRKVFGSFYASLFDDTMKKNPKSVLTEYAWASSSCDPCPSPPLTPGDIMTLGGDVMPGAQSAEGALGTTGAGKGNLLAQPMGKRPPPRFRPQSNYVLTRLHTRYDKSVLGEDLVFRTAAPIVGGRERGQGVDLEQGAKTSSLNNFQARYIIRHRWRGPVTCKNPVRGHWGGPWQGVKGPIQGAEAAQNLAFVQRGLPLTSFVKGRQMKRLGTLTSQGQPLGMPVPNPQPVDMAKTGAEAVPTAAAAPSGSAVPAPPAATSTTAAAPAASADPQPPGVPSTAGGCAGCVVGSSSSRSGSLFALLGLLLVGLRRLRRP